MGFKVFLHIFASNRKCILSLECFNVKQDKTFCWLYFWLLWKYWKTSSCLVIAQMMMRCLHSLLCRHRRALTWRGSPSPWWPVQPSASQYGSREPPPVRPRRQNPCGPRMAGLLLLTVGRTPSPKWGTGHTAKRPRTKALLAGRMTRRVRQGRGTAGTHRSTAKSRSRMDSQNNIWTKPGPLRYNWMQSHLNYGEIIQ